MSKIYKILPRSAWDAARAAGTFAGSTVDLADGFIHFSGHDTAQRTAELYFKGQTDLLLLTVEADDLGEALKWEASRGGALFPHLFRALRVDEVAAERALELDADGVPILGELAA
uniref:Dihydroorotate dehydrogenase n=1 Tax=Caulobacter sp. (strain K31) TaxID=366602 RepID=B0T5G6_CAUSK